MKNVINRFSNDVPLMIMMCGLPASGKSYYAAEIEINGIGSPVIHSSDKLRKELWGDESIQGDNGKLFNELHRRIEEDLKNGKDVIYDATNINKKQRIHFLKDISKISCNPICIVMAVTYEDCLKNNSLRERNVPDEVIERMLKNWNPPHYSEGFQEIVYVFPFMPDDNYFISEYLSVAENFDQENSHHTLTLGKHSWMTVSVIRDNVPFEEQNEKFDRLCFAALLHDNGKLLTKTRINRKGIRDGECHYYQHHCVGAYNSMFYLYKLGECSPIDIAYISNLIYYHMHPYMSWKQSEKARNKDRKLLGSKMYDDILLLHKADVAAH